MTFSNFLKDESGAITVDWVVLTAAIVGIAIAVLTVIAGGINTSATTTTATLSTADSVAGLIGGNQSGTYAYADLVDQFGAKYPGSDAGPNGQDGAYTGVDLYESVSGDGGPPIYTQANYDSGEVTTWTYNESTTNYDPTITGTANSDGSITNNPPT